MSAQQLQRITIGLTDLENGWTFRLHSDDHRVWLDSLETDAPVPLSYVAGAGVHEFETAVGNSCDLVEMIATAKRLLPGRIAVSAIEDLIAAP